MGTHSGENNQPCSEIWYLCALLGTPTELLFPSTRTCTVVMLAMAMEVFTTLASVMLTLMLVCLVTPTTTRLCLPLSLTPTVLWFPWSLPLLSRPELTICSPSTELEKQQHKPFKPNSCNVSNRLPVATQIGK